MNRTHWVTLRGARAGSAVAAKLRGQPKNAPVCDQQINAWEGEGGQNTPSEEQDAPVADRPG